MRGYYRTNRCLLEAGVSNTPWASEMDGICIRGGFSELMRVLCAIPFVTAAVLHMIETGHSNLRRNVNWFNPEERARVLVSQ